MHSPSPIIRLPRSLQRRLEAGAQELLNPPDDLSIDFSRPAGESALLPADSISWRIFKNPLALLIGGLAAVILELAEPAVRTGVWEHSTFRSNPMRRLQRTGLAAMVTVYGARSVAEPMIARVVRMHSKVAGETAAGVPYSATDPRLLTWVQATATFGFAEAYSRYVRPLSQEDFDRLLQEGSAASTLYGALQTPTSYAELQALFAGMRHRLEPSPIIFEFLDIMRTVKGFPMPLCWMQGTLVRAAVDIVPAWIRERLGLTQRYGLRSAERWLIEAAGGLADRVMLSGSPSAQACSRLGIPPLQLYART